MSACSDSLKLRNLQNYPSELATVTSRVCIHARSRALLCKVRCSVSWLGSPSAGHIHAAWTSVADSKDKAMRRPQRVEQQQLLHAFCICMTGTNLIAEITWQDLRYISMQRLALSTIGSAALLYPKDTWAMIAKVIHLISMCG